MPAAGAGAPVPDDRDMADLAGIAEGATIGLACDDDAKPEASTEIDLAEMAQVAAEPMEMLSDRRRIGVVLDHHWRVERVLQQLRRILPGPARQRRGADRVHALDLEGAGHHDAATKQALGAGRPRA